MHKNLNFWTKKDLEKLRSIYKQFSLKEMSVLFGRSPAKICRKARQIGLAKDRTDHSKRISVSLKKAYANGTRSCIGSKHPNWKMGIGKHSCGYLTKYAPEHPNNRSKRVLYHRLVVEKHLGRFLTEQEIVHHIDSDKTNNNIENLQVMTQSEHAKLHAKKRNIKHAINNS